MSQATSEIKNPNGSSSAPIDEPMLIDSDLQRPIIYVNGEMKGKNEAMVSVYDHGLLYGDGVFEGIRVYNGKIFKSKQHMDRLYRCAEKIQLAIPISKEEMVQIQRRCIEANELVDGYIRLIVTRGAGTLGLNPRTCPTPGIVCIADQIALYPPEMYEQGMSVVVAKRPRVPIACLDPRIKSLNYLNNILAKTEAIDRGLLEAIMLNTEGYVSECTGDNIFVIKDGAIFTPPSDAGILEGITREFVMETVAPACGYRVEEKMMRIEDVLDADEVFLTGSAAEMIAVTGVITQSESGDHSEDTEHVIGADGVTKAEGPITRELRTKFREIVTSDDVPEE
jgi:branched-chain amino acid aminotransferase